MEFKPFPKIARWSREVIITEKIDGTNACVVISDDGKEIRAQSRTRFIQPGNDNFGFALWVEQNKEALLALGPGHHFGEWWGVGIQRGYGLHERRFSLFNVTRWQGQAPAPCHVVPVLKVSDMDSFAWMEAMTILKDRGSIAAPGFMNPEGIVIYHTHSNTLFKKTFDKDDAGKGHGG
jgi:hypothetical protein